MKSAEFRETKSPSQRRDSTELVEVKRRPRDFCHGLLRRVRMETSMVMIFGILALLLRVGFALHASGSLRSKNAAGAILRITADTAFSTVAFWAVGAAILLQTSNSWFGIDLHILFGQSQDVAEKEFFHLAIILIGGAIVAGALAERARFYVGIAASIVLSAIVIPVIGHWVWFGWLKD